MNPITSKLGLAMLAPILLDSFAGFSPASWYPSPPQKKPDPIKKAKRKAVKEAKRRNR